MNQDGHVAAPASSPPRRKRGLAALVILGTLMALAVGVWFWRRSPAPEPPPLDLTQADPEITAAIAAARQDVVDEPASACAWGILGMEFRAHDYVKEANVCFAQAERLDPADPRWPYLQGLTLQPMDAAAGIVCLQRAAARCSDRQVFARLRLVEALLDSGALDEAEQRLEGVPSRTEYLTWIQFCQGRLALLRQQWRPAVEHLTACVNGPHARRQILMCRALAYRKLGEQKLAEADESRALKLPEEDQPWPDPFAAEVSNRQRGLRARLRAAHALQATGQLDQAVQLLQDTARAYPASDEPWLHLANIWVKQERLDLAEQAARRALAADAGSIQAWFALGCCQAVERPREGATTFRRVLQLKADHALAHYNLAQCLRRLGDTAGAREEYRATLLCRPDYDPAAAALKELQGSDE
ncbi:MAG TPA: tetratricopeptide repeat protein [Gemmataceae bacterium]|nr:tetratricopeptide repeat protein [Gemmataceae bacterium]